jgi:hypothetical protein
MPNGFNLAGKTLQLPCKAKTSKKPEISRSEQTNASEISDKESKNVIKKFWEPRSGLPIAASESANSQAQLTEIVSV